jgi:hypothetical protein
MCSTLNVASSVWPWHEADHSIPAIVYMSTNPYTHGLLFKFSEGTIFYLFIAVPFSGSEKKHTYAHSICHHTYACNIELRQCYELS